MENTPRERVASNVRRLRQDRGWSLATLCERLADQGRPTALSVLSKMERGDRGVDVDDLVALASALEVSADLLLVDPAVAADETARKLYEDWRAAMRERAAVIAEADRVLERAELAIRDAAVDEMVAAALRQVISDSFRPGSHWSDDLHEMLVGEA